jgi:iron complex outermembrane recepter protein
LPPVDQVTYGAHLYNPVQGGNGILGRYFKAGVRAKF